jgi:hypothetical protein
LIVCIGAKLPSAYTPRFDKVEPQERQRRNTIMIESPSKPDKIKCEQTYNNKNKPQDKFEDNKKSIGLGYGNDPHLGALLTITNRTFIPVTQPLKPANHGYNAPHVEASAAPIAATELLANYMEMTKSKEESANAISKEKEAAATANEDRWLKEVAEIKSLLMKQTTCRTIEAGSKTIPVPDTPIASVVTHTPPNTNTNTRAIFDSGTTGHYILLDTDCIDKKIATQPIVVSLPNGEKIRSTHEATLPFPDLPEQSLKAHIFPGLHGHALLSIGIFCDAGCTATFSATEVDISFKGKTVLTGRREPPGLWKTTQQPTTTMPTTTTPTTTIPTNEKTANGAYTTQLKSNAIKFLHAACFSPTTATWTKAINHGFFRSWPLLTAKIVRQHLPKSVATTMGHLDQSRQNQRSTKLLRTKSTQDEDGWITPAPRRSQPKPSSTETVKDLQHETGTKTMEAQHKTTSDTTPQMEEPTNTAYVNMIELTNVEGKSYSDLTG